MHDEHDLLSLLRGSFTDGATFLPAISAVHARQAIAPTRPPSALPSPMHGTPDYLDFFGGQRSFFKYRAALNSARNVISRTGKYTPLRMTQRRLPGSLLFSDSGGFQFAKKTWPIADMKKLRPAVLSFQQTTDVAISMDVPTEAVLRGAVPDFGTCLDLTMDNHDFYAANIPASCATVFLNVLQGDDHQQRETWLEAVRSVPYTRGWALSFRALGKKFSNVLLWVKLLHGKGLLTNCRHIHILGAAHLQAAVGFSLIARAIRKHLDIGPFTFTYDSASPAKFAGMGRALHNWRFTRDTITLDIHDAPDDVQFVGSQSPFPYITSPLGKELIVGDLCIQQRSGKDDRTFDGLSYALLVAHNTYVHISAIIQANRLMALGLKNPQLYQLPIEVHHFADVIDQALSAPSITRMIYVLEANRDVVSFFDTRRSVPLSEIKRGHAPDPAMDDFDELDTDELLEPMMESEECCDE